MRPLDPIEIRILGVLAEKEATTPNVYPLTLAAVVAGSNQSTNRDPVMDIDDEGAESALVRLHDLGVATPVRRQGDRATKYRHKLIEALEIDRRHLAVLAVLMLRGAQTPGELRQRTDRYVEFESTEEVDSLVDMLAERRLVERLPREPGQSQRRVIDLLGRGADVEASTPTSEAATDSDLSTGEVVDIAELAERIALVEQRLNDLMDRLGE